MTDKNNNDEPVNVQETNLAEKLIQLQQSQQAWINGLPQQQKHSESYMKIHKEQQQQQQGCSL